MTDLEFEQIIESTNQECIRKYGKTFSELIAEGDEEKSYESLCLRQKREDFQRQLREESSKETVQIEGERPKGTEKS